MKYFEVSKEVIRGSLMTGITYSDGSYTSEPDETGIGEIVIGLSVFQYAENGENLGTKFYPVTTNTATWENDMKEQLEKIKEDFPPEKWENYGW